MSHGGTPAQSRLAVPGLVLALVVTAGLPAWAGAASTRPDDAATVCAGDAGGASEPGRC